MVDAIDKTKFTSEGKTIVEYDESMKTEVSIFYMSNNQFYNASAYNTWVYYYTIYDNKPYLTKKKVVPSSDSTFEKIGCIELIQYNNYFEATVGIMHNGKLVTNTIILSNDIGGYEIIY